MSKPAFLVEIIIWNKRSLELRLLKLVPGRGSHQWQWNSYVRREENTSKHNTLEVTYGMVVASAVRVVPMPVHCL